MRVTKEQTLYSGEDLDAMEYATNYYRWVMDIFAEHVGENIVEVGAGSGTVSEKLLEFSPKAFTGIEPATDIFPMLKERFQDRKHIKLINSFLVDAVTDLESKVDTIFYINVLEHVVDDEAEMKHAFDVLKPGGKICIFVPALPWVYGKFDEEVGHERRYYKKDLENLLTSKGFEIVRSHYFDLPGAFSWWLYFKILHRSALSSFQVKMYDRLVVPVLRVLETIVKPPFGKNLVLVAQKPTL